MLGRVGLERAPELLALVAVHAAVQLRDARRRPCPAGAAASASQRWVSRYSVKTMTRSSFQCRRPGGRRRRGSDQLAGLGVGSGLVGERPAPPCRRSSGDLPSTSGAGCVGLQRDGPVEGVVLGLVAGSRRRPVGVVEELVDPLGVLVPRRRHRPAGRRSQGLQVDRRRCVRTRPGWRTAASSAAASPGRPALRPRPAAGAAPGAAAVNSASSRWTCALALGVLDGDRRGVRARRTGACRRRSTMSRFSRRTTISLTALAVRVDAPGEALVVEQLQQRGERLLVAVVRGRGQEQPVLEVRREPPDRLGLLRVDGVDLLRRGRGDVVRLVEDQQVEARAASPWASGGRTSSSSRCALGPRSQGRLMIVSGKTVNGLAALPRSRRTWRTARSRRSGSRGRTCRPSRPAT